MEEMKNLDALRRQIHRPCREVLECLLVAKRLTALFAQSEKNFAAAAVKGNGGSR